MHRVNVAVAKAQLSELIDRAVAGEEIEIMKRGEPMVRLTSVRPRKPLKPFDWAALKAFTDSLPYSEESSVDLIRRMRDEKY